MFQLSFTPQSKPTVPINLEGFERFYDLLRALVCVQDEATFYERLQILLQLARRQGEPPTIQTLARELAISLNPQTLSRLREAGWLVSGEDDRRYSLTAEGHLLIVLLQMLAQPWAEDDISAVAVRVYEAAEALGVGAELLRAQFDQVLSILEQQALEIEQAIEAEDTALVESRLHQSKQNVQMAEKALELRKRGATSPDDYEQVQRMHRIISSFSQASPRLENRYKKLLARDLLAQGAVTLGDILAWAQEAEDKELGQTLWPHLKWPYLPLWDIPEVALLDAAYELEGKTRSDRRLPLPMPTPLTELPASATLDEIKQQLYRTQEQLRQHLKKREDPLPLSKWVAQDVWEKAVAHFVAALDPQLRNSSEPVYLQLETNGYLEETLEQIVHKVTQGQLSLQPTDLTRYNPEVKDE